MKLTTLSAMQLKGEDARKFLQGQLTCDIDQLSIDQPLRGAHCNREGRVVALYDILATLDAVILITPAVLMAQAIKTLKHYALFSKVVWEDLQNSHEVFADAQGQLSLEPKGKLILDTGDETEFYYQRMMRKWAVLTEATVGKFLPQELELDQQNALSYTKGCYLGQEVVARVHYRGKLKRALQLIESAQPLHALQELKINDAIIGEVVASVNYQDRCYALALINNKCEVRKF